MLLSSSAAIAQRYRLAMCRDYLDRCLTLFKSSRSISINWDGGAYQGKHVNVMLALDHATLSSAVFVPQVGRPS